MSQAGIIDIEQSHPQIPTIFVTNVGTAIPIANTLEILGTTVAAHSIPLETTGSGNTVTVVAQYASAVASSSGTKAGFASFNSTEFTVDANGYVSLSGTGSGETITGNIGGALSPVAGNWNILGTSTAAGTIPVQTSGTGNTLTVQVQKSQAIASTNATNVGLAAFNSTYFSVDSNGFVSLVASSEVAAFTVDAHTAPGTNPVVPNGSGIVTITGGQVAAGTTSNVIQTNSLAANTYTIQIQRSQAVASSTVGDNGVSHFNSAFFTVDSNGFVSLNGSAVGETITGNTGGALSPTAGNWNIPGNNTALNGFATYTTGSGSTLTVHSFGRNKWVVNPTSGVGTHTTISSAMAAASAGDTIVITANSSPYTENVTLTPGVNLVADTADAFTPNVTILGTLTMTSAGTVSISGINLKTNSAPFLSVTGSAASIVNLRDCFLNASNNNGIVFSSSSSSAQINITNCNGDILTTGINLFSHSSQGAITIIISSFSNSGGSTVPSTCSAGVTNVSNSVFSNPFTYSGTGQGTWTNSTFITFGTNSTCVNLEGGITEQFINCNFITGSVPAINVITNCQLIDCFVFSSNQYPITGSGTLNISSVVMGLSTGINPAVGVVPYFMITGTTISFSAYLSTTQSNVTGDGTIVPVIFDTALVNYGGGYNTSTGVFTAPFPGNYQFNYIIFYGNTSVSTAIINAFQGNNFNVRADQIEFASTFSNAYASSGSMIFTMAAGDTMFMTAAAFGGTKTASIDGGAPTSYATTCMFSGFLIG